MNPKFRSTFLTLSTLWVEKINTLQVWQGEIVMSDYDTTQKHTSTVQCSGYNVLILGWTKCVVLERSLRHCFLSPAPRVAVSRRHKWRSFVQRISLELDRDKDSIKLRGPSPPYPTWVPCPSIFSKSLLFSSNLTVTNMVWRRQYSSFSVLCRVVRLRV